MITLYQYFKKDKDPEPGLDFCHWDAAKTNIMASYWDGLAVTQMDIVIGQDQTTAETTLTGLAASGKITTVQLNTLKASLTALLNDPDPIGTLTKISIQKVVSPPERVVLIPVNNYPVMEASVTLSLQQSNIGWEHGWIEIYGVKADNSQLLFYSGHYDVPLANISFPGSSVTPIKALKFELKKDFWDINCWYITNISGDLMVLK